MPPASDALLTPRMLRLRPVEFGDEQAVRDAHARMAEEGHEFAHGLDDANTWQHYLQTLENSHLGIDLPGTRVPESFLLAVVGDTIVGRAGIRHRLNARLSRRGGHIGYAVLPEFRRRGYGTAILSRAVPLAHELGIDPILVTCDDTNQASIRIIENGGGVLDRRWPRVVADGRLVRRYWI